MTDSSKEPSRGAWTPGPWNTSASLDSKHFGVTAYLPGLTEADRTSGQHYYVPVCAMSYGDWQDKHWLISKEEYRANALLISKAPQMADLLRELCKSISDDARMMTNRQHDALVRAERLLTDLYPNEEKVDGL